MCVTCMLIYDKSGGVAMDSCSFSQTSNTGLEPLSGVVLGSSMARRASWGEILQEAHLQGGGISNAFFRAIQAKLVHKDPACVHGEAPRNKAQTASYPPTSRHLLGLILI